MKKWKNLKPKKQPINDLVKQLRFTAFNARRLGEAVDIMEEMIKDKKCVKFLGLSGALIPAGMRLCVTEMIKRRWVDIIVSTGANITHDLAQCFGEKYEPTNPEKVDELVLKRKGYNLIFDHLAPVETMATMEKNIQVHILKFLEDSPSGLQMEEIAEKLGLTRHTVAKYLEILRAEGKIHYRKIGRSKLWKEISSTINIRMLGMDDLEDILRIEEKIERELDLKTTERMEHLKKTAIYHLQQDDPLLNLGAEIDGKLVGFVFAEVRLWEFGRGEKTGWIKVLGVDPEYQGRGIGRKLGETLLGHFKRKNINKVRTLVDWYEGDLISYFKSLGFNILNMIPLEKELK